MCCLELVIATCAERYRSCGWTPTKSTSTRWPRACSAAASSSAWATSSALDPRLVVDSVFSSPYALLRLGTGSPAGAKIRLTQLADEPLALLDLPQSRYDFPHVRRGRLEPHPLPPAAAAWASVRPWLGRGLAYTMWTCGRPWRPPGRPPRRVPRLEGGACCWKLCSSPPRQPPDPPRCGRRPELRGTAPPRRSAERGQGPEDELTTDSTGGCSDQGLG